MLRERKCKNKRSYPNTNGGRDWTKRACENKLYLHSSGKHKNIPFKCSGREYSVAFGLQMAKRKRKSTEWVERVELYIAGMELANGYSELTDPNEQKERFENEQKKKTISGTSKYPVDIELISALRMGIPPSAGIALGIDRLVMLFTDRKNIQDVLLFPLHQYI